MNLNAMIPGSPCIVCHPVNGLEEEQLRRLRDVCDSYDGPVEDKRRYRSELNWSIHSHCRYGLSCNQLRQYDNECERIAEDLEPTLIAIASTRNELYHRCYELCRGYFPAVCRQLEVLYAKGETNDEY